MRLRISRDQAQHKGLFGGNKGMNFIIRFKADLDDEELNLIQRYKADREWLAFLEPVAEGDVKLVEGARGDIVDIGSLVKGVAYQCKDVATLIKIESKLRDACNDFKSYLTVMASFGGEEFVEY